MQFITYFANRQYSYYDYMAQYPFYNIVYGTIVFSMSFLVAWLKKDKSLNLFLLVQVVFSLFFFVFIAQRGLRFAYVSHVYALATILIVHTYYVIIQGMDKKILQLLMYGALCFFVFLSFRSDYAKLYQNETRYGRVSEAYQVIIDSYHPCREVIFGQYLRSYYLRDIPKPVKYVSMLHGKDYEFDQFIEDLNSYPAGWLTWETRKSYHIQDDIIEYVDRYFEKLHGSGIDDTYVEVYYYDSEMLSDK